MDTRRKMTTPRRQRLTAQDVTRFQEMLEQTRRRARERLGATAYDHARWVLRFAERDPRGLLAVELADLRDDLRILAAEGAPSVARNLTMGQWEWNDPVLTNPRALRSLWRKVVALTRAGARSVTLPPVKETYLCRVTGPRDLMLERRREATTPGVAPILLHTIADVLSTAGIRLRLCPECKQPFVAVRRQERHPACAQRARDRRRKPKRRKNKEG